MTEYKFNPFEGGATMVEVTKPEIEVVNLAEGFGFGEGGISASERKLIVGEEVVARVEAAIASPDILVPVSTDKEGHRIDDDGCGDGRPVKRIFQGPVELNKSLDRSKVFGGGAVMTAAMEIGLGEVTGIPMKETLGSAIGKLKANGIDFGAHTDDHAHGDNSGCGAIDKAPAVIANTVKYKENIVASINALGVNTDGLDEVLANFATYNSQIAGQEYKGAEVVGEIIESGKIVKELENDHREMFDILNMVEGFTVNQELVRQVSDGQAQAFAVDVWRLQELAQRAYPDDAELQNKAFLSELVYTLGVSATLTLGDQPVRVIQGK